MKLTSKFERSIVWSILSINCRTTPSSSLANTIKSKLFNWCSSNSIKFALPTIVPFDVWKKNQINNIICFLLWLTRRNTPKSVYSWASRIHNVPVFDNNLQSIVDYWQQLKCKNSRITYFFFIWNMQSISKGHNWCMGSR